MRGAARKLAGWLNSGAKSWFNLPVEVVQEAIAYAVQHQELLDAERTRETTRMQQLGLDKPPYIPTYISTDA